MKRKTINYALILFVFLSAMSFRQGIGQDTNTISLSVNNIKSVEGKVLITLHRGKENFLNKAFKSFVIDLENLDPVNVKFENLEDGVYTISIVHDENDNNQLDTNIMGIPSEPYGISMDGKRMFGAPEYEKAKFEVKEDISLTISL